MASFTRHRIPRPSASSCRRRRQRPPQHRRAPPSYVTAGHPINRYQRISRPPEEPVLNSTTRTKKRPARGISFPSPSRLPLLPPCLLSLSVSLSLPPAPPYFLVTLLLPPWLLSTVYLVPSPLSLVRPSPYRPSNPPY